MLHTHFGSDRDFQKEINRPLGRKPPPHLRDHVWESIDGWVEAEAEASKNRHTAEQHIRDGVPQIFPANPKRRGISAAVRGGCSGNADEPFNHVPGEDPSKWEKAHHFKRFASRPEMIHDSVWGCTGYAKEGLPQALANLLPQHSSTRNKFLRTAARDVLVADGSMPPPLPKHRKLWAFQKREISLSKKLTVPPRPPQTLEEKYPDYQIIYNPETQGGYNHRCIGGCCMTCGTNLKPWNGLPQNVLKQQFQQQQLQAQLQNRYQLAPSTQQQQQKMTMIPQRPSSAQVSPRSQQQQQQQHVSQHQNELSVQNQNSNEQQGRKNVITLPRSVVRGGSTNNSKSGLVGDENRSPLSLKTTSSSSKLGGGVYNTRAASATVRRKPVPTAMMMN